MQYRSFLFGSSGCNGGRGWWQRWWGWCRWRWWLCVIGENKSLSNHHLKLNEYNKKINFSSSFSNTEVTTWLFHFCHSVSYLAPYLLLLHYITRQMIRFQSFSNHSNCQLHDRSHIPPCGDTCPPFWSIFFKLIYLKCSFYAADPPDMRSL